MHDEGINPKQFIKDVLTIIKSEDPHGGEVIMLATWYYLEALGLCTLVKLFNDHGFTATVDDTTLYLSINQSTLRIPIKPVNGEPTDEQIARHRLNQDP